MTSPDVPGSSVLQSESTQCRPEPRGPAGAEYNNSPPPKLGRPDHSTRISCAHPARSTSQVNHSLARARAPARQSTNSNDWGIQEFRAFRTLRCAKCPMAPKCRSTKFSKCASTEDAGSKSDSGGLADCRAHTFPTYGTYGRTAVGTPRVSLTLQSQTSALLQPQYSTHGTYHRMAVGRHQH